MTIVDFPGERREVREPGVHATPFVWRDPRTIPTRQWLFGRHAIRRYISATVASGGTGKTSLLLTEAVAYASGRDLLADALIGRGGVWYLGLEDPREEYERRIAAAILHHQIAPGEIDGRLFLDTGRDQDFVIARERNRATTIIEPIVSAIIAECREHAIDLIVVDRRW
jgi:RecA-family ATPase